MAASLQPPPPLSLTYSLPPSPTVRLGTDSGPALTADCPPRVQLEDLWTRSLPAPGICSQPTQGLREEARVTFNQLSAKCSSWLAHGTDAETEVNPYIYTWA